MTRTPMAAVAVVVAALLCSCSGSRPSGVTTGDSTALPATTPHPTAPRELLFAVVERKGGPADRGPNTVAIVGLDGYARVKATFDAYGRINVGNAAAVLPASAMVAAGSVFYVDRHGVVRVLTPGHALPETVTTFPAGGPTQEVGFAVDPSGRHLVAAVLTLPAQSSPPADCPICTDFVGPTEVAFETADRGGTAHTVRTIEANGDKRNQRFDVVAWDDHGPVAALDQAVGTQSGMAGWEAHLVHIDAQGKATDSLGGADCVAEAEARDGTVLCLDTTSGTVSVRRAAGRRLAALSTYAAAISDDGKLVAYADSNGIGQVGTVGGPTTTLPRNFLPQGFIDDGIVIGELEGPQDDLGYVRLSDPSHQAVDLGFTGTFVGTVQKPSG
jgi:hypothetical protein